MKIDDFYSEIDKSNFYLGLISAVFRENSFVQVENLSLLSQRRLRSENLIPNTINYLAVVDSAHGLFIGEIYQSRVNGSDSVHDSMNSGHKENIFPEIGINVIAILQGHKFVLAGVRTVGITDRVYIANQSIIERYFNSLEINEYPIKDADGVIQKDSEGKTKYQKKLNDLAEIEGSQNKVLNLAPNTLFDRHLMAVGTTNSGKSTSALSILDKLLTSGKKVLIIDPTGEYDSSFTKESKVRKLVLGKGTFLSLGSVTIQQWSMIVGTNDSTQPAVLADAIKSLRFQFLRGENSAYVKVGKTVQNVESDLACVKSTNVDFDLEVLPQQIAQETRQITTGQRGHAIPETYVKNDFNYNSNQWLMQKVESLLENTNFTNFFKSHTDWVDLITVIDNFIKSDGDSLYIDSSKIGTSDGIGAMIVDLISNHIVNRTKKEIKPFVMYVDEVHRYTQTAENYTSGLISIAREGRKKGIFLFLTTQNPKDVPDVVLGQIGTMIVHRLTHFEELKSIQNHVSQSSLSQITKLNQGEAILTSINLLQDVYVRFKKSGRPHGNDTPLI